MLFHMDQLKDDLGHRAWWETAPPLRKYVNRMISGDPESDWLEYSIRHFVGDRIPLEHCVSFGCGDGSTERRLIDLGVCEHCDGFESAEEPAFQTAIMSAEEHKYAGISYHPTNFINLRLPSKTYALAIAGDILQHLEHLEASIEQIRHALTPSGLLVVNGYVGPSRFQFPARQKELIEHCLALIPAQYRQLGLAGATSFPKKSAGDRLLFVLRRVSEKVRDRRLWFTFKRRWEQRKAERSGQHILKDAIAFPTVNDILAFDPSLAVRSGEIVSVLQRNFTILEKKGWGGCILQFLLAGLEHNFPLEDSQGTAVLEMLIDIEETLVKTGVLDDDFMYIAAKPLPA